MAGLSQGSEPAVAASPKPAVAGSPEDLASQGVVGSVSSGEGFVLWKWWKLVYYILVCQRPRGRSFLCVPSPKPPPGPPWEAGDSDAEEQSGCDRGRVHEAVQGEARGESEEGQVHQAVHEAVQRDARRESEEGQVHQAVHEAVQRDASSGGGGAVDGVQD